MDNLVHSSFQLNKVRRAINVANKNFAFCRYKINDFKEPIYSEEPEKILNVRGIFHISSSFQIRTNSDSGNVSTDKQPMILALYEKAKYLQRNDIFVDTDGAKYKVVDVSNLNGLGIIAEISLEVVSNG